MAKIHVLVTDPDWYRYLKARPHLQEIGFWRGRSERRYGFGQGEIVLFKLRGFKNAIAGGAFFDYSTSWPASLLWDLFGESMGVSSAQALYEKRQSLRIAATQKAQSGRVDEPLANTGIAILTSPFYFDEQDWFEAPNWSNKILDSKGYVLDTEDGKTLWERLQLRDQGTIDRVQDGAVAEPFSPATVQARRGQAAFKAMVADNYKRQCAVSREKTLPVLEAAHIRPYAQEPNHSIKNGLLLRRDIHTLFDRGYVTVSPEYEFLVSRRLGREFGNGRIYYELEGRNIGQDSPVILPDPEMLGWHNEKVFKQ